MARTAIQNTSTIETLGDRYEVLDLVGQGAAAWVYRVRDSRNGAIRAAKVLKPEGVAKPEVLRRYEDEYRILRQLHHPSLPEVYDYGWLGEQGRYMVMEYVDGQSLDTYFRDHPEDLWVLIYELCEVLGFIHDYDLLHQDIKPSNILVRRTNAYGRELPIVTLIDFGLIHRREPGERAKMVGTVAYMAPEVISGKDRLTRAVDYYSLGVTLYELLAGRLPFEGSARDVVAGHLNGEAAFEEERLEWAEIYPHVLELLAKDVNARLEAFEGLRRAAIGHMTGGIEELEKAYGLSLINSLGLTGDTDAWSRMVGWITEIARQVDYGRAERAAVPPPVRIAARNASSWSDLLRVSGHPQQEGKSRTGSAPDPETPSGIPIERIHVLTGSTGSGKSYFVESLACEAAIRGISVFRTGEQSDYLRLSHRLANLTIEARRAEIWRHLEVMAERGGCLVLLDHDGSLTEEERAFAEYTDTRLGIISDKREDIAIYALHQARTASPIRRRGEKTGTAIEPLNDKGIGRIVDVFRGRVLSARSLEVVRKRAAKTSRSPGMLIGAIRSDFASGRLRYRGRQWLIDRDLNLQQAQRAHRGRVEELLKLLPPEEQEFFWALSAHPGYATTDDVVAVTGLSAAAVVHYASRLESYGLAHVDHASGKLAAADSIPQRASGLIPRADRRRIHARWIARLSDSAPTGDPNGHAKLAFHHQQVGRYRDAMIGYMRAVRLAERVRSREVLHTACESGGQLCESKRVRNTESAAVALRRWFLKKRILAYWAEQNYPRILSLTDEFVSGPDPLPVTVMPIVAYAMIMSRSPTDSKAFIHRCWRRLPEARPVRLRTEVMLGLAEHNLGRNQNALQILSRVQKKHRALDAEYRARSFLYTSLAMDALGQRDEARKYLRKALSKARQLGHVDLIGAAEAALATELFTDGKLTVAKRMIAAGLRSARRNGLLRRIHQHHFNASTLYYELDDYDRALRHLERATRLAEALAQRSRVVAMIIRYGMLQQQIGHVGTASEYVEMALRMSGNIDDPRIALLARLVELELALQCHDENISSRVHSLARDKAFYGDASRRGYLETLIGDHWRHRGDYAKAAASYRIARKMYHEAGWDDDAGRARLREAVTQLELGNFRACERLLSAVKVISGRIENPLVGAEARLVELMLAFIRRDGRAVVLKRARACEVERRWLKHAELALRMDETLIRAYARIGNRVGVKNAAERYMRQLRTQVANAMECGIGKRMTSRPDIATLLDELLILKRKGLLAN